MEWGTIEIILQVVMGIAVWLFARPWSQQAMDRVRQFRDNYNLHKAQDLAMTVTLEVYQSTVKKLQEQGEWNAQSKRLVFEEAKGILTQKIKDNGVEVMADVIPMLVETAVKAWKGEKE